MLKMHTENVAMSDISTTDSVFFMEGERCILGCAGNASLERPDAPVSLLGLGETEQILLQMEVEEE